jgi:hypothetical protein
VLASFSLIVAFKQTICQRLRVDSGLNPYAVLLSPEGEGGYGTGRDEGNEWKFNFLPLRFWVNDSDKMVSKNLRVNLLTPSHLLRYERGGIFA